MQSDANDSMDLYLYGQLSYCIVLDDYDIYAVQSFDMTRPVALARRYDIIPSSCQLSFEKICPSESIGADCSEAFCALKQNNWSWSKT